MTKHILIAEDNLLILELLQDVLSGEQFEVDTLDRGAKVIATAERNRPDLIILDMRLPDSHGGEICRALKVHPVLGSTPVLLSTAYTVTSEDICHYGCDAVLTKPFDLAELLNKVGHLLNKHD